MPDPRASDGDLNSSQVMSALRSAIAATERRDYATALRIFSAMYGTAQARIPDGLSHYGLCLAKVEKKFNLAIKSCNKAIELQFYNSSHYVNLIDVYFAAGSRKKAVEVLEKALARLPNDPEIVAKRAAMGYRERPVMASLHRDNPLNIVFGRMRTRSRRRRTSQRAKILIAVGVFVTVMATVLWFLFRNL